MWKNKITCATISRRCRILNTAPPAMCIEMALPRKNRATGFPYSIPFHNSWGDECFTASSPTTIAYRKGFASSNPLATNSRVFMEKY